MERNEIPKSRTKLGEKSRDEASECLNAVSVHVASVIGENTRRRRVHD